MSKIEQLLEKKQWNVQVLKGKLASEDSIKAVFNPRILHIATHGYFKPDSTFQDNSLLQSGLFFSSSINSDMKEGKNDGILTSAEAMELHLDSTELVVLSACETGLGEIKNEEGVYGLQRAFRVSGAKSLIMSLWRVNDEATREFMVEFY